MSTFPGLDIKEMDVPIIFIGICIHVSDMKSSMKSGTWMNCLCHMTSDFYHHESFVYWSDELIAPPLNDIIVHIDFLFIY